MKKESPKPTHPLDQSIANDRLQVEMKQTEGYVRSSFTSQQLAHLSSSIRFADAKAGALVTVNGLVLKFVTDMLQTSHGISDFLFKISLLILIVSILFSLAVVYPKSVNIKAKGLVYWNHINNYQKDEYMKAICEGDVDQLLTSLVENNYHQATILTKKFQQLEWGFKISIVSYLIIAAALIFTFFS